MNSFTDALTSEANTSVTFNGAETNKSSLNPTVDLFFQIGASRGKDLRETFDRAYKSNRELALRVLFWARDVRAGAGERQTYRTLLRHLEQTNPEDALLVMKNTPFFGRWDDILVFETEIMKKSAAALVGEALRNGDGLCAKWMPRKGSLAAFLRKELGMTPKQWRKTIVNLTKVVETKMCARDWNSIDFQSVPSVAAARYRKAFMRNATESYQAYVARLVKGEAKINASAIFPHDVLRDCFSGYGYSMPDSSMQSVVKAQWEALPNYLGDNGILPMVDVSGSMFVDVGGVSAIQVAVSLGLYIAEKQTGDFKDCFLTFTDKPTLIKETGDLFDKIKTMTSDVGYNTDFEAAYSEILRVALKHEVKPDSMPKYLLVLSDMEFDKCQDHQGKPFDDIKQKFNAAGYVLPKMIFWNLNGRPGNVPVTFREDGTALVSGYSQNILKSILSTDMENFTPETIMMNTVMVDRYNVFGA